MSSSAPGSNFMSPPLYLINKVYNLKSDEPSATAIVDKYIGIIHILIN